MSKVEIPKFAIPVHTEVESIDVQQFLISLGMSWLYGDETRTFIPVPGEMYILTNVLIPNYNAGKYITYTMDYNHKNKVKINTLTELKREVYNIPIYTFEQMDVL